MAAALDLVYLAWPEVAKSSTEAMILNDPWRNEQASFGAFLGSRLISYARFHYRPLRIGEARLRMAGVADVVTDPEFRRQGLAKQVLSAGLNWMKASRMTCSLLFGAPHIYSGLGWGNVRELTLSVPIDNLSRLGSGSSRIESVSLTRLPDELGSIYDASCGSHPISLARTPSYWRSCPSWKNSNGASRTSDNWVVAWQRDRLVAYGLATRSHIAEICSLPGEEEALFDVFDNLVEWIRQEEHKPLLRLSIPLDHLLVAHIGSKVSRNVEVCCMILVSDLPGLLGELTPELVRRWRLDHPARLRLEYAVGSTTLIVEGERVRIEKDSDAPVLRFTASGLSSLLLGFQSVSDLQQAQELEGEAEAVAIADRLFPCLYSHYWAMDGF